ncbi:MAG: hypothetical protein N2689_03705 [Verrucomicrobiae bacterium]|nr:hypothetical protein [Verrucomicrobiae bacterium]
MSELNSITRREFLNRSMATAGTVGVVAATASESLAAAAAPDTLPLATLGKTKISRVLLGGNLISGYMHSRDLKYVNDLFRAYATEQKILETLKLAEECGINTVFETGANFVQRYNREFNGHMQFIPHIQVKADQSDDDLRAHIEKQVESGACALYVWGVAADRLVQAGAVRRIARAVELAKLHDLPVGVGGHSLLVPMACEKHGIPCDFYVKTFHSDNYPSATPKELRKEFIWLDGGKGWYDNMWCINPEETAEFMKTVSKPWIAFKVLAAGAIPPQQGFLYAFKNGADLIAVGMLDFQIRANCDLARKVIRETQKRERPWRA